MQVVMHMNDADLPEALRSYVERRRVALDRFGGRAGQVMNSCARVRLSDEQTLLEHPKVLKRILVGTDFCRPSADAVVRAAMLAAEHTAELEIVHVTPRFDHTHPRIPDQPNDDLKALVRPYGVTADLKIMGGGAAEMLAIEAAHFGADLVVLGRRKNRSLRDAVFGTTAERFLKRWTGDTLVVGKSPLTPYRTILACVSLAPESCSVVNSALALSTVASLSVLHCYQPPFEKLLFSQHAGSKAIRRNRATARRELALRTAELLQRCALPDDREVKIILRHGHPSVIPGTAARHGVDVIIVGRSTSVIDNFIFGSVTKNVLRSASSDVLVSHSC
jgi:nucleotide-binding universal stress UspA family protein